MARFKADPQVAQRKQEEIIQRLEQGIQALANSEDWHAYLEFQSRFHSYSFNNCILIQFQMPDAGQVAGYRAWQGMGRQVRKGEKGIVILAPLTQKIEDEATGESSMIALRFRPAFVFDVSQTDGEEIPQLCHRLHGDDDGLFSALGQFAASRGFSVQLEDCGSTNGFCEFPGRGIHITVNSALSPLHRAKTLAHELGHALMHSAEEYRQHNPSSVLELEAESAAFIILSAFGLDSGDYSFAYVSHWSSSTDKAISQLKASGTRIQKAANEVITGAKDQFCHSAR
jgi:antirestriction protein ArdC